MNSNEKISFRELIESGQLLPEEPQKDLQIFKDKPQKRDYTIFLLSIIAILSICACIYYSVNAMQEVKPKISVSGISIERHQSSVAAQYKNGKVNINTAGVEVLCTLKSIGESKALSIIAYREANGPFKSISDIKNVSGIGDSTFENIKNNICI
ncbi:MAG: ComEA family DNA-binding protein [Oscillospiraceae bacterium]|nr:ComEA family DNA-binding protein [Oscillospiraceae bacterium]